MWNLIVQLAMATVMVGLTILLHLLGLGLLLSELRRRGQSALDSRAIIDDATRIILAGAGLFVLHGIEIWGYAAAYWLLGAISSFESALYFSITTYSTIGYGDIVLDSRWRIMGAIEGVNGVILLGWSTAFFVAIVSRIRLLEREMESQK